jgi:LAO/AO transport system kinase
MGLALEAGGFDIILVETAGAGQSEVDIARLAHTTLVVEAPGLGDDIQAAKAGILEIADILVVNKADKSGADATARSLTTMLEIGEESKTADPAALNSYWKVPVLQTSALDNEGVDGLIAVIRQHKDYLEISGEWEKREQARLDDLFERLLRERLFVDWRQKLKENQYQEILGKIHTHVLSPHQALNTLLK